MRRTHFLPLSTIFLLLFGSCQEKMKTFIIPEGHVGMFGYGSLMSKSFIESGLLEKNYDGPFLSAHLEGYRRSWTFAWPSALPIVDVDGTYYKDYILVEGDTIYPEYVQYLNIRKDASSVINGVLYIVPEADLPTYDAWELGYERMEVTGLISDFVVEGGPVFAYTALPDFVREPTSDYRRNIIEFSYAAIIQDAFGYWGKEFEEAYRRSTVPPDTSIVVRNQRMRWINPPLEKIDELRSRFTYTNR